MVFIGNPRSETNREGGNRIVLRSQHSNLNLRHTCSILSIKIEVVEMGGVSVVIALFLVCVFSDRGFVFVFFINPIGAASGIDPGRIDFKPGANLSTTPFFERGLHLSYSRWFYRPAYPYYRTPTEDVWTL